MNIRMESGKLEFFRGSQKANRVLFYSSGNAVQTGVYGWIKCCSQLEVKFRRKLEEMKTLQATALFARYPIFF